MRAAGVLGSRTTGGSVKSAVGWGGRVGLLVVDNQGKRNAMCGRGMEDLWCGIERLRAAGVVSVLLCGARGSFCSGAEMPTLADGGFQGHMHDTLVLLRDSKFVSYALLEGYAIGGGAELAMAADCRMWVDGARLRFVQATKGIPTGWGGMRWLVEAAGREAAVRVATTSTSVSSYKEALALRLVTEQVALPPDAALVAEAHNHISPDVLPLLSDTACAAASILYRRYKDAYPDAVAALKRVADASDRQEALAVEEEEFHRLWRADDHNAELEKLGMI